MDLLPSSAGSTSGGRNPDSFQELKSNIGSFFNAIHFNRNFIWVCKLCSREFELKSSITQHLKFHHNITRNNFYSRNMESNELAKNNLFKDEILHSVFFIKLKEILPSVVDKYLSTLKCVFCNCILKNIVDLMQHLLEEVSQGSYICKRCSVEFSSHIELTDHAMRCDHQVVSIYVPNKIILTWAFGYIHDQMITKTDLNPDKNKKNVYKCVMCDCSHSFTDGFDLQSHLFDHCCYKPLLCGFCKERFADFRVLFNHITHEHNKPELQLLRESISFIEKYVDSKIAECIYQDNLMEPERCYTCNKEDCSFKTDKFSEYASHRMSHYVDMHSCPFCSIKGTDDALSKHVFHLHNDILTLDLKQSDHSLSGTRFHNNYCDLSECAIYSKNDFQESLVDAGNPDNIKSNLREEYAIDLCKERENEKVLEYTNKEDLNEKYSDSFNSEITANKVSVQSENEALLSNPKDKNSYKNQDYLEMIAVYVCNYCHFQTVNVDFIKKHFIEFHYNDVLNYKCKWLNKFEWYLQARMNDEIADEDFKCAYCSFASKIESLVRHLVDNHPFVYACGNCNKLFSSIKKVVEHDRLNHIKQNMKIFLLYDRKVLTLNDDNIFFSQNSYLPLIGCADGLQMIDVTEYKYRNLKSSNCRFAKKY